MGLFSRISSDGGDGRSPLAPIAQSDHARRVELLEWFEDAGLGWFWATDGEGRLIYLSRAAYAQPEWDEAAVLGKQLGDVFTAESGGGTSSRPLNFLLGSRTSIAALPVRLRQTGRLVYWEISGKPQFDKRGNFTGYRGSARDITISREKERDAEVLAHFDSLTGLVNRRRMETDLKRTLAAYCTAKRACALMMLDLDRFKQVNDTLGHQAGDELLKQVAGRLNSIIDGKGTIGRQGGDEFLIMLPDIDDRGTLGEIANRLIQMLSQPYSVDGIRAIIGTSVGIAVAPYDGVEAEDLIGATDLALYAAKGGGRGQFRFFSSDLKDGAHMRRRIEEELRDAIAADGLEMHYQPIVATRNHCVTCMEALIRWNHPERGFISPAIFIPIAEDLGLIREIGAWILRRCCHDAAAWPVPLRVAVNVSAMQFARDDFALAVAEVLRSSRLDPARLELEITESVFLGDEERTQRMFEELKALGIRLALDDFGTGYSSLSYLQRAPFDKIKIDRTFVRGATDKGNNNAAILGAIVNLAEALGMETVAEGVEAKDELELVKQRGASHVQGHIFAEAMSQDCVIDRLEKKELEFEPRGPSRFRAERRSLFRHVGVIHDDHRYRAVLRNLSKSGAMIEGLLEVPIGTELVLDLGGGQLAVCTVKRSRQAIQGVEFETPLVSDGADGLCTRHRVSPYAIEAAGRPLAALPNDAYSLLVGSHSGRPAFVEVLTNDPRTADPATGYGYRYHQVPPTPR